MHQKKAVAQAVSLALAYLAFGTSALAQDTVQGSIQRVEVTGSSIKRATAETASPIQVISRDDIAKSGKATVAEYLQTLTADGAGSLPTGFGNGFAAGSTAISLRGLGATSTLVLLNGRRMAPFARADDGQKSFTDLSTVPMEAVERIEVLKDGASSTYGADAIAGVVNIILRKDFTGLVFKIEGGESRYHDAEQGKAAITWGKGRLDEDGYNWMINAEVYGNHELMNKDRSDRDWIGHGDIRPWGYAANGQFASGYITPGAASPSPAGAIRDPKTGNYVGLAGCSQFSPVTAQDPAGGCLWYADQFRSMQPKIGGVNLYTRFTKNLDGDLQLYGEAGYSKRDTEFTLVPPSTSSTVAFPPNAANPSGVILYGNTILMAPNHPQNPYGVATRVRYSMFDVGPSTRSADNEFSRFVVGLKGQRFGWDFDTGYTHSESALDLNYSNMINMKVLQQALGNPSSQYFPYYIGTQAGKNPASLYAAMVVNAKSHSTTELDVVDFKASRELFALPGGNMGLAVGAEYRRLKLDNPSLSGSEDGTINSSYVAAKGTDDVKAVFVEVAAPVLQTVELTGAVRYDKYKNFNSTTPKLGAKWTPIKTFALRGTYSEGFRAPGPAESGTQSQSTGNSSVRDPIRCPGGTPAAGGATQADCSITIGAVKVGNPNLQPEESKGYTLGMVWDPLPNTSFSLDAWKIKRSNEINPLSYVEAAALPTAIRQDNNLVVNGVAIPNTGTLLLSNAPYQNSSYTEVKGVDLDLKQRIALGSYGRAVVGLTWTHVATWMRVEKNGTAFQYAGTHGNCDTSNCAGTPKNKISVNATWDYDKLSMSAIANWRDSMDNVRFAGDKCASQFADGSPAPYGCKLASFMTVDLSARYKLTANWQLYGSIQNLFDKVAPLDPLTYGGLSYNPMDASGAIGRYFKVGARYQF
ncbi:TonB-dependent receptor [Massilia sp. YIM B02763]|uniref:TonB-dependent receptor n=1 Tax=Massilia sp. YIM B02763 TaxID=3050130 RepID=UPI0025B68288|nr:TonB-dependent receptor [Massilia sp. YIM B02763]MDN4052959.1 TonB-dependent receptor [Massilia sp. YIM B02763]